MYRIGGRGFFDSFGKLVFIGCLIVFCNLTAFAQSQAPVESQATSVLLAQAREMLEAGNSPALLPYLREILVRLEGNSTDEAQSTRIFCMYQIGAVQMQNGSYADAIVSFGAFIKAYPDDSSAASASLMSAEAYILLQNWVSAEQTVRPLLDDKRFNAKQQLSARRLLAEALYRQQKWSEATVPLLEVFKQSEREEIRSSAALMLAVCHAKSGNFEELNRFLPYCNASVRQDAGLNMALIEIGDKKSSDGDYYSALKLYRMVFLKQELLVHYQREMAAIKEFLAQPFVSRVGATRSTYNEERRLKQVQYDRMEEQLKTIKSGSNYDLDIALRMARCYAKLERSWVAYTIYNRIYTEDPKSELAGESRFQAFMLLLNMPQEQETALREGADYLAHYPAHTYTDEVSLNLMQLLLSTGKIDEAQAMGRKALQLSPNHRYIDQVRYLLAFIDFQKQDYEVARATFTEILSRWPKSLYAEASEYWQAMCNLFLAQYDTAVIAFENYLKNPAYPKKSFDEDASYRLGVAFYGQGDFPAAEQTFRHFLDLYPSSVLRSEAFCMLGDLRGAEGELDVSLDFYRKGLDSAANLEQVNYAVFQAAKVYELQKNYPAIIELMESYLKDRGEEGNFAGAGFWMGKSYKAMSQYSKAISTYVDTVVRFGNVPGNDNVDLILRELIKEYKSEQGQAEASGFMKTLDAALRKAQNRNEETLALRIQTLFAYTTEGAQREPHIRAILKEENIEKSGALTLQLLAEEAFQRKNYDMVYKVCDRFSSVFEASEIFPDIMNIKLKTYVQQKRYEDAVALAEEITGRFGYQKQIGLTRKLKADALRLSGRLDEAVKTYNELFAVREWRGPLTPESLYWIGVCLEQQAKPDEAFAFFQRVYVLYEEYVEWTAKAYVGSVRCLEKLGRSDEALKTIQEMLSKPAIAATAEGRQAQAKLTAAGGAK
jgi:TolA-binding protein/5-hydroxyisourate hydrolase-like protein (transthyretin family)